MPNKLWNYWSKLTLSHGPLSLNMNWVLLPQYSISSSAYLPKYLLGHIWSYTYFCTLAYLEIIGISQRNVSEQNLTCLTRIINTRNNIFSTMHSTTRWVSSFVYFKWACQICLKRIYIFLYEKVTNTITVHGNTCSNVLFWCIETNTRIHFRRKIFLFSRLTLIQMICLLKL